MKRQTVATERKMTKGTAVIKWPEPVADNCIKQRPRLAAGLASMIRPPNTRT